MNNGLTALLNANPGMELCKTYKNEMPGISMTSVYLVSENGKKKVVKMAPADKRDKFNRGAEEQIIRESRVLQELDGFYNTPKHLGDYDLGSYIALSRENLDFEYIDNWKGSGKGKYQAVKNMIESFHDRGISGLDLQIPRNIAILDYSENDLTLFDFGKSVIKNENSSEYKTFADADELDLFRMFAK